MLLRAWGIHERQSGFKNGPLMAQEWAIPLGGELVFVVGWKKKW